MIQVRVAGVALDAGGGHVILLRPIDADRDPAADPDADRVLPIWIGAQEASAILIALEGAQTPRPLTHELMLDALASLGVTMTEARITRIDDGTFYAEIELGGPAGTHMVDARPSDAVTLAIRAGVPIRIADAVLAEAGVADPLADADADAPTAGAEPGDRPDADAPPPDAPPAAVDPAEAEADVAEFTKFLDEVDPDDFKE